MSYYTRGQEVYVIMVPSGHIKIGVATDSVARMALLQTGCPEKMTLIGATMISDASPVAAIEMERLLHAKLSRYRVRGEWFRIDLALFVPVWRFTYRFLAVQPGHPKLMEWGGLT